MLHGSVTVDGARHGREGGGAAGDGSELLRAAGDGEIEVAKLRALFRTAFSRAPLGMAIVDSAGAIVIANESLSQVTGHSAAGAGGAHRSLRSWPRRTASLETASVARSLAGEASSFQASVRLLRADGAPLWVSLAASATACARP